VVDSQTQDSRGGAVTYVGGSNGFGGFVPTVHGSVNMSRLAQRLSPHSLQPGNIPTWSFFPGMLALSIFCAYRLCLWFTPELLYPDPLSWWLSIFLWFFPGMIAACVVGFLFMVLYHLFTMSDRRLWRAQWGYLNSCFYCFRDDTVFDHESWAAPEHFVPYVFGLSYDEMDERP
jgi:hypothetical protein